MEEGGGGLAAQPKIGHELNLEAVLGWYGSSGFLVDSHGVARQAVLLLKGRVEQIELLGAGRRAAGGVLKQLPRPLQLGATLPGQQPMGGDRLT